MAFIKDRLKQRRLDMGLTLQEVANALGVEKPTVQMYESGVIKKIDTLTVEKLAEVVRCSPAYLMGWEENKKRIQDEISSLKLQIKSDTYSEDTSAIQKQFIEKYSNLVFKLKDPEVSIADKNAILKMFVDEIIYNKNSATVDIAYFI